MPRIAVVDDQPDMRQQLCSMIDQYSRENNCMLERSKEHTSELQSLV